MFNLTIDFYLGSIISNSRLSIAAILRLPSFEGPNPCINVLHFKVPPINRRDYTASKPQSLSQLSAVCSTFLRLPTALGREPHINICFRNTYIHVHSKAQYPGRTHSYRSKADLKYPIMKLRG